jgi:hypothetical protein
MSEMRTEPDAGPFTLRWTFEQADLRDALTGRRTARRQRRRMRVVLLVLLVLVALAALLDATTGETMQLGSYARILGLALLTWAMVEGMPRLQAWLQWRGTPLLHGDWEAVMSAAGVRVRGQVTTTEHAWPAFQQVDETKRSFLLAYSAKAQGPVVVLPKRALTNPADIVAVRHLLHRMIAGQP